MEMPFRRCHNNAPLLRIMIMIMIKRNVKKTEKLESECCWFWFHLIVLSSASEWQVPETLDAAFVSNSTFMTFVIDFISGCYDAPYATEMAQV